MVVIMPSANTKVMARVSGSGVSAWLSTLAVMNSARPSRYRRLDGSISRISSGVGTSMPAICLICRMSSRVGSSRSAQTMPSGRGSPGTGRSATTRPPRRLYTVSIRSRLPASPAPTCKSRPSARANLQPALESTLQGQLLLAPGGPLRRYPVHLQRSSLAHAWYEPMIRMLVAAEGEQGAALGRHLGRVIVYVVRRADQTQPAAGVLPLLVEVDENGDDFRFGVVMDVAVLGLAILPNGDLQ